MNIVPYKKSEYESLTEVGQSNKLRWVILYRESEDTFREQTIEFKCKDYFNDYVSKYAGKDVRIYGMDTSKAKVNDEGVYILVKNLAKSFTENVRSINLRFVEPSGLPSVQIVGEYEKEHILLIPRAFFDNTYYISLLTYLIRIANVDELITNWVEHPTKHNDNPIGSKWYNTVMKGGFKLPIDTKEPYVTAGAKCDLECHNCGVKAWWDYKNYMDEMNKRKDLAKSLKPAMECA